MGQATLVVADNTAELPPDCFRPQEAISFEIELACITE
jgi:hypothetical protein